jgi:hypothetical protein
MPFIAFQTISFKSLRTDASKPLNFNKRQSPRPLFIRWRFYLFLKTENSRRVAESCPVCVGLYTFENLTLQN